MKNQFNPKILEVVKPFTTSEQIVNMLSKKGFMLYDTQQKAYVTVLAINHPFLTLLNESREIQNIMVNVMYERFMFSDKTPFGTHIGAEINPESVTLCDLAAGKSYHVCNEYDQYYMTVTMDEKDGCFLKKLNPDGTLSNSSLIISPKLMKAKFYEILNP